MGESDHYCTSCGRKLSAGFPRGFCPQCMFGLKTEASGEKEAAGLSDIDSAPTIASGDAGTMPRVKEVGFENEVIGNYKVLQKLGEGGFGVVYMAEQLRPVKRRVALKIIKMGMDTQEIVARFEAERQALAMMEHPGIAKVFDAGATERGRPYFVMELVKGIPITHYCDERRLSTRERLELFMEVCHAVQHAHQKGIIHRDLKPSNVMISIDGEKAIPKVIDFGIAKATHQPLTDRTLVTRLEQFVGTPMYMSPEQAQMSGLDIDTRSDIYSLGVLLYELLTGQTPFEKDMLMKSGVEAFRRMIREEEPQRPSTRVSTLKEGALEELAKYHRAEPRQLSSRIRGDLDWIVMKAMEKDRTRRYESASGLAADIGRHLNNQPVSAAAPSVAYTLAKFARRNRKVLLAAVAVGLALVAGIIASTTMAVVATRARHELNESNVSLKAANRLAAERLDASYHAQGEMWLSRARQMLYEKRFLGARIAAGRAVGFEGFGRATRDALFGERYPVLLEPESAGGFQARRILGGEFDYPMLWACRGGGEDGGIGHTELVHDVAFSPTGRMLASASFDRTIRLWDAATGEQIGEPLTGHEGVVWKVAFSPDGSMLASCGDRGELTLWDLKTRTPRRLAAGSSALFALAFDPDGTRLAAGGYDRDVRLWDVASGQAIGNPLQAETGLVYDVCFDPTGSRLASVGRDNTLRLWDVEKGARTFPEIGHREMPDVLRSVAFHPDGGMVATAGDSGAVHFWATPDLVNAGTLDNRSLGISALSFSPDGMFLATSGKDSTLRLWQVETSTLMATLEGHQLEIERVAFSPDGAVLASCGNDNTVRLWHIERSIGIPVRAPESIGAIQYARDGEILVASTGDGQIGIYDSVSGQQKDAFRHDSHVTSIGVSPDHALLAVGCENHAIYLWNLETSTLVGEPLEGHFGAVTCLRFDPNNRTLASGGADGLVILWSLADRTARWNHQYSLGIRSMDFNPSGELLAAAGDDGSIHLWKLSEGDPVPVTDLGNEERAQIEIVTFDPSGTRLASAGKIDDQHLVRLWSIEKRSLEGIHNHGDRVHSLCFAQEGAVLAIGDENHLIHLWDFAQEADIAVLRGHAGPVLSLSIDPRDQRLASSSTDGTVRTWQLDPNSWNSTAHLLTALEPPLFSPHEVTEGRAEPSYDWNVLAMGETALNGAGHYLALLRSGSPSDRDRLFWRFCQARNWSAAQRELDAAPAGTAREKRWFLAQALADDALRFLRLGEIAMARTRVNAAAVALPDAAPVLAARAAVLFREGDPAGARTAFDDATVAADGIGATPTGRRVRFDVAWQRYHFLLSNGPDEEIPSALERVLAVRDGMPIGKTTSDLLAPLIGELMERAEKADAGHSERYLRTAAAIEIMERLQRKAALDLTRIPALRALEKQHVESAGDAMEIMPMAAEWNYFAEGRAPSPDWNASGFDDHAWKKGPALLGFGADNNITTLLPRNAEPTGLAGDSWNAFYFRHPFDYSPTVESEGDERVLSLQITRDDGVVVYLNGKRIVVDNMREADGFTYETFALEGISTIAFEQQIHEFDVPSNLLQPGRNVFAAEVHQNRPDSSDLHFGMAVFLKRVTAASYFAGLAVHDPTAIMETLDDVWRFLPPSLAGQWREPMAEAFRAGIRD